jgi:predicted Zn-dependent protease
MTQMFGVQVLLEVIAGKQDAIKQVGSALIGLKFSRNHEVEADNCSVQYLCPTAYNAAGGAGFFQKIQEMGGAKVPEFLSTHPDPGNRIQGFNAKKEELNCRGNQSFKNEYQAMVKLLP